MSNYNHLTAEQRVRISVLLEHHNSIRSIAKELGCNASTISREIKRNSHDGKYECKLAQVIANSKLTPRDEYSFQRVNMMILILCLQNYSIKIQVVFTQRFKTLKKNIQIYIVQV